jgi:hypothetical protein
MKLSVLLLVAAFVASGFSSSAKEEYSSSMFTTDITGEQANVPFDFEVDMNPQHSIPFVGKSYYGFCNDLGFSESSGNYSAVNRLGYIGKYQFGWTTLNWVGIYNKRQFLNSPLLQEKAFEALISKNKWVLKDYIDKYTGQVIKGVRITESGLIAAAHLGGAGNVKKFLESNGNQIFADGNNVPITKYMKKFANYDLTSVEPDNNATATL